MTFTKFDNHAPINFENAEILASSTHDGGAYNGIGYNNWYIKKGKQLHFYHVASSGCEYNGRTDRMCEYLFGCRSVDEMVQFLLEKLEESRSANPYDDSIPVRFINELLEELGYAEEA